MPPRPPIPRIARAFLAALALLPFPMTAATIFFGNYADSIRAADFDPATGRLAGERAVASLAKASFLAKSADGRFLYAVAEADGGSLHAFEVTPDKALTVLNAKPSDGKGPCDIALSPDGRLVAAANYGGGSVIVYRVEADGRLGERAAFFQHSHASNVFPGRQKGPHAHGVTWSPDGRLLLVPDLGGDRVYLYACDPAKGELALNTAQPWLELSPGSGPRHAQFSPDGRQLYVVNELSNTVGVAAYDSRAGTLKLIQTLSTLRAEGFAGATKTAEIAVHPAGHTVYASNRGADTLAIFKRDAATGRLTAAGQAPVPAVPRHFALSPDGRWLLSAGHDTDRVAVYAVDPETGALAPAGEPLATPKPACVRF